jgi:hypothetical protein
MAVAKPSVLIPNVLKRECTVTQRNKACVTDITYIRTWQGWLYLAVVMDPFSRKIVGRAPPRTIHREVVLNAVLIAVRARRPRGTVIHSDQGTQFGSDAWRRLCRSNHLEPSMSRKGNCWDNAVVESSPELERLYAGTGCSTGYRTNRHYSWNYHRCNYCNPDCGQRDTCAHQRDPTNTRVAAGAVHAPRMASHSAARAMRTMACLNTPTSSIACNGRSVSSTADAALTRRLPRATKSLPLPN